MDPIITAKSSSAQCPACLIIFSLELADLLYKMACMQWQRHLNFLVLQTRALIFKVDSVTKHFLVLFI